LQQRITDAHKGIVTSLQFAGKDRLVSAGQDFVLSVWKFEDNRLSKLADLDGRSGDEPFLGVSPDGSRVLFDQG
jgi:hypothetical protein